MKTLWDSINDKEHFAKVVIEAIDQQLKKMTPDQVATIIKDWSNQK